MLRFVIRSFVIRSASWYLEFGIWNLVLNLNGLKLQTTKLLINLHKRENFRRKNPTEVYISFHQI